MVRCFFVTKTRGIGIEYIFQDYANMSMKVKRKDKLKGRVSRTSTQKYLVENR